MTFFSILETLLIGPLKLVFEIIFDFLYEALDHYGLSIIFLSLVVNLLILPLYRRADAMQEKARDIEEKLHDGVSHIKKTFSGDERMMILQTYYRQNDYKPTDVLNGSVSLLLEIPFFIAAYQFLSHLELLKGASFGPIMDLGAPDGLLVLGGISVNLLPIIMTMVNVVSSAIYLKGFPAKTKIQLYAMALFFLVFLYASPAGLVLYWTMNNIFSLIKNIFYKLKNPLKTLRLILAISCMVLTAMEMAVYDVDSLMRIVVLLIVGLLLFFPKVLVFLKEKVSYLWKKSRSREKKSGFLSKEIHIFDKNEELKPNRKLFILSAIFLTVLMGMLIPSVFIAASPQEYVDITYFHNPLWYVVSAFCLAAGTFLVWVRVIYWLAGTKAKIVLDYMLWIMCGVSLVNYMFFGTGLGVISANLQYENGMYFTWRQQLINYLVIFGLLLVMYVCARKWKRVAAAVLTVSIFAMSGMVILNLVTIKKSVDEISKRQITENDTPGFRLSKTGQNVVVLMIDAAMGEYVPYIFNEKPELVEKFSGFTYYENTLSFGGHTNYGSPAMLGGYEYTPVEMNKRSNEALVSKHNEALKVMPVIFSENGYEVTMCDPVYANYQWIPDLSIYDDYPDIKAYITKGRFSSVEQKQAVIDNNSRNFFCFSLMKSLPLSLQYSIYDDGNYHQVTFGQSQVIVEGISVANGIKALFMESYQVLACLSDVTEITGDPINTFLFMDNDMVHDAMLLQEPEYVPEKFVDNTKYDSENANRFFVNGRQLKMENSTQMSRYQCNMAAMIQLGNWFDYMRENGVYDNTRIILVSDHGRDTYQIEDLILGEDGDQKDVGNYFPLLMVKDFNSVEFVTSGEFMTNADVPTLAMEGIVHNPVNPFTGNVINSDEKYAHEQFVVITSDWNVKNNNGNTFTPSKWASVKNNIWDKSNWTLYDEMVVLDKYEAP